MVQREVFHDFESGDEIEAFARVHWKGPEERWAQREAFYLEILRRARAGEKDPDFQDRFPEDSRNSSLAPGCGRCAGDARRGSAATFSPRCLQPRKWGRSQKACFGDEG